MDALEFLEQKKPANQPIYVLTGEEDFLRRAVRESLERQLLGDADREFAVSVYAGDTAQFSTIKGELDTLPFLSPRRIVVIELADPFVSEFRPQLERLVEKPSKGVLILEVKSWPSNTRLYKMVPSEATIQCKAPPMQRLPAWCVHRAAVHGKKLTQKGAEMLVELIGASLGILDQELSKLAAYVGDRAAINDEDVDHLVGRSRAAETFKIFDAIGAGRATEALTILDRLLKQGEEPMLILGALSWQLRKIAQAGRLAKQGVPLSQALLEAGFREFALRSCEQFVRHLGWRRLERLFDWLLDADLGIKGNTPVSERLQLERLVVRLAQPREAAASR